MVATADLRATQDGVIWPRRPLVSPKGLLSCLQNLPYSSYDKSATRFGAVTFNSTGEVLVATDEKGRVFAFFVTNNRYALVQHLGVPTVASAFSPVRKTELLITCENDTIRCIDVQSQSLISTLRGHRFPAQSVSFQQSGKLALTASQDAVILWDTRDWSRYRVLNAGPGVEEASFVSRGDLVAVCFQDDSIMMWELESLALRYRFSLPEHEEPAGFRKITVSDDYKMLVATGRSRFVYVWDFESQTIIRVIELPTPIEEVVMVTHLPAIVYPMIKIFRENDLAAFEASLCVLLHWCREFLSSLPYPPVFVLSTLETKLEQLDPQLHDHFVKHNVGAELYAWSLLKTIFTEVLSEDEWVCLWDHLFTYPDKPWMLQVAVLAYLSYFRTALLGARDRFSIEQFFHQQNAIKIQSFIQLLVNLSDNIKLDTTNESNQDEENTTAYWPMPKGQYPAFANFPRFIVDFQISERNRIALEEAEMLQKKKLLAQAEREGENLKAEHHKWLKQREALLLAEEKRRTEALEAEKHRILSLRSLDHETRKRRLERLALLEKAAQETLEKSSQLFQAEYHRLDSELAITKERTEFEISSRQQEEELQRLEFETERRVQGIHRQREMDERLQQIRSEFLTQLKQNELQDLMAIESWKRDDEVQRAKAKVEMERKEKLALLQQEKAVRQQLQNKLLDHMMSKEQELQELRTHRDSRMTEERAYEDIDHHLRVHEQLPPETRDTIDSNEPKNPRDPKIQGIVRALVKKF
ncbi:hypothetical protein Poli38472_003660 [Pythium oligandrum]|uniref:TBC1 domain family member 31 n=1 Tax=Pythium oligandrum TaxID=41045 RepID=A0A8K1FJB4_PYTOL|nr:hypothetical protein Poli38472_003660 [Pythium oligandrum]|eukprot:TMW65895.1 hypothetical protein Poli38472_003660 [Pythium oligandrum]